MDIFTIPDPSDSWMGYAYIAMIFVFLAASFTVYKLKKSANANNQQRDDKVYDMYDPNEEDETTN